MTIFRKIVSDIFASTEKRKALHREVQGQSSDDLSLILARDRIQQKELDIYKNEIVPTLEKEIAVLKHGKETEESIMHGLQAMTNAVDDLKDAIEQLVTK